MPKTPQFSAVQTLSHRQELPAAYRLQEVLAFHRRDAQQLAEQVEMAPLPHLRKALYWHGQPAWLELQWRQPQQVHAQLHLPQDGEGDPAALQAEWAATVRRMLGLAYPPQALEAAHGQHPQLGALLRAQAGLHVPAAPTAWEALTWAITGQQISVAAAVSLRRRLVRAAGTPLAGLPGVAAAAQALWAYPDAAQVHRLGEAGLLAAGYSQSKTRAMLAVAQAVLSGVLPLDAWVQASDAGRFTAPVVDAAVQQLLALPGIGPWTVHYTLLRGLGWPDGSLHGDVAVRKALAQLQGGEQVGQSQARDWLAPFAPWRALVAAHLWASLSAKAY